MVNLVAQLWADWLVAAILKGEYLQPQLANKLRGSGPCRMEKRVDPGGGDGEILGAKHTRQLSNTVVVVGNWDSHTVVKQWCEESPNYHSTNDSHKKRRKKS